LKATPSDRDNTFGNVGTITLRSDANRLYGLNVLASITTTTAAEANQGMIQVTSSDLGLGGQICACPPMSGGGIATNDNRPPPPRSSSPST